MLLRTGFVLLAMILLCGCGNVNTTYRRFNVDDGRGAMVDIKQRAIIVSKQTTGAGTTRTIVCAEPSPDALSAYATELAAKLDGAGKVQAQLVGNAQETASFVGLRTQSIQLLRDALFRLCEGYLGGALSSQQYDTLMRRYQRYMIALLGIEQLTAVTRSPTVIINAHTKSEVGALGSEDGSQKKDAQIDIAHSKKLISALEAARSLAELNAEQKAAIEEQLVTLNNHIKRPEADQHAIKKTVELAPIPVRSDASVANVPGSAHNSGATPQHIESVAQVVRDIVIKAMDTDELGQLCWGYVTDPTNKDPSIRTLCGTYLDQINQAHAGAIKASQSLVEDRSSGDPLTPAEKLERAKTAIEELRQGVNKMQK